MTAVITKEPLSKDLVLEILPLAQLCWEENTLIKADTCAFYGDRDFEIDPYITLYEALDKEGRLVILTVRELGTLVGYSTGYTYISPHHAKAVAGMGDSIYLDLPYRSLAQSLVLHMCSELKALGAIILGWPTSQEGPVYPVLKSLGFAADDVVMEKRLCA